MKAGVMEAGETSGLGNEPMLVVEMSSQMSLAPDRWL